MIGASTQSRDNKKSHRANGCWSFVISAFYFAQKAKTREPVTRTVGYWFLSI